MDGGYAVRADITVARSAGFRIPSALIKPFSFSLMGAEGFTGVSVETVPAEVFALRAISIADFLRGSTTFVRS